MIASRFGLMVNSDIEIIIDHRKDSVGNYYENNPAHHRAGGRLAHSARPGGRLKPANAADRRHQNPEDKRFHQTSHKRAVGNLILDLMIESDYRDAKRTHDHSASDKP